MNYIQKPLKPLLSVLMMACFPLAYAASSGIPGAGNLLQQITPGALPEPSSANTGLALTPKVPASLPTSAPFAVKTILITGNTRFTSDALHTLVK